MLDEEMKRAHLGLKLSRTEASFIMADEQGNLAIALWNNAANVDVKDITFRVFDCERCGPHLHQVVGFFVLQSVVDSELEALVVVLGDASVEEIKVSRKETLVPILPVCFAFMLVIEGTCSCIAMAEAQEVCVLAQPFFRVVHLGIRQVKPSKQARLLFVPTKKGVEVSDANIRLACKKEVRASKQANHRGIPFLGACSRHQVLLAAMTSSSIRIDGEDCPPQANDASKPSFDLLQR